MMSNHAKEALVLRAYRDLRAALADGAGIENEQAKLSDDEVKITVEAARCMSDAVRLTHPKSHAAVGIDTLVHVANAMVNAGYRIVKA